MTWAKERGVTLLELVIVIAIIGILASIAYPSYQEHIRKSRRADCTTVLLSLANALERRYSTTTPATYGGAIPAGFATCPPGGGGVFYDIAVPVATQVAFDIQATPAGAQLGDRCGTLTLNHAGVRGVVGAAAGVTAQQCW